ncbi:MAG: M50 family metallopeptidase [Oscillospiraceae bacterium]|nr:M50 family metallopeptidase [Oscillospiraceae bacterium]
MGLIRWQVSAGGALLFALLYFFDPSGLVAALLPAALAHELGHAAALSLGGARLRRLRMGVFGLELDYAGYLSDGWLLFSAAAGPGAGLIYAAVLRAVGTGDFCTRSAAVSLGLSLFNLLPVLPLDGGRMLAALTDARFAQALSRVAALILAVGGALIFAGFRTPALLVTGIWLCVRNFRGT